jgi:hypothetical protein
MHAECALSTVYPTAACSTCTAAAQTGTGFAGTTDPVNLPPSEALAVGPHPTDDGKQKLSPGP